MDRLAFETIAHSIRIFRQRKHFVQQNAFADSRKKLDLTARNNAKRWEPAISWDHRSSNRNWISRTRTVAFELISRIDSAARDPTDACRKVRAPAAKPLVRLETAFNGKISTISELFLGEFQHTALSGIRSLPIRDGGSIQFRAEISTADGKECFFSEFDLRRRKMHFENSVVFMVAECNIDRPGR